MLGGQEEGCASVFVLSIHPSRPVADALMDQHQVPTCRRGAQPSIVHRACRIARLQRRDELGPCRRRRAVLARDARAHPCNELVVPSSSVVLGAEGLQAAHQRRILARPSDLGQKVRLARAHEVRVRSLLGGRLAGGGGALEHAAHLGMRPVPGRARRLGRRRHQGRTRRWWQRRWCWRGW